MRITLSVSGRQLRVNYYQCMVTRLDAMRSKNVSYYRSLVRKGVAGSSFRRRTRDGQDNVQKLQIGGALLSSF